MKRIMFTLIAFLALSLVAVPPAQADIISYPNFSSTTGLEINPGAAVTTDGKLSLTQTAQQGSAFYATPVTLPANYAFTTTFTFSLTGADGMTFCLHQDTSGKDAVGARGGELGYSGGGDTKITPSIAVEFDTYDNGVDDPSGNHVAIDTNGIVLGTGAHLASYDYTLNTGTPLTAWVEYNGSRLRVYLASDPNSKPGFPMINYAIDLSDYFSGPSVYVGFTGGDYFDYNQLIHSWTIDTNPVPLPGALLLLGTGLLGLAGLRRYTKN